MAEFRNIHTRIWKDAWFSELKADERLVFIYLFSNERASVCGMYELPLKYIVFETGIKEDRVSEILNKFSRCGKAHYQNDIVWVVNLRKYNDSGNSSKVLIRADKDLDSIPDCEIKRKYFLYVGIPYPESKNTLSTKNERDGDGDGKETDTDTETEVPDVSEIQRNLETTIGLPISDIESLNTIEKMNPLLEDIQDGYNWYYKNRNGKPFYLSGMIGPIQTAMNKRLQKKPEKELTTQEKSLRNLEQAAREMENIQNGI